MRTTLDRPAVRDIPPPEAAALIVESRRRQRRRWTAGASALVAVGLALTLAYTFDGSPPLGPDRGGHGHGRPPSAGFATGSRRGEASLVAYTGVPFTSVAVSDQGDLYYVDQQYGVIDELTAHRSRVLLRSLHPGGRASHSIDGLTAVSVAHSGLWFTAQNAIYEVSLDGRDPRRVAAAPGATDLAVLADGTIYFTTFDEVFEREPGGPTRLVAGGGRIPPPLVGSGRPATAVAVTPHNIIATSPSSFAFTTTDNDLDVVRRGVLTVHRTDTVDFFNGAMTVARNGAVFALCGWQVCRIDGATYTPMFPIPTRSGRAALTFLQPEEMAVAPNGDFYVSYTNNSVPIWSGIYKMAPGGRLLGTVVTRRT